MNNLPPAGWYSEPNNLLQERYFDGNVWTASTRPKAPSIDSFSEPPQFTSMQQPVVIVMQGETSASKSQYISGLTTGEHIKHGALTVITAGLWGPVWAWKAFAGRRRIK